MSCGYILPPAEVRNFILVEIEAIAVLFHPLRQKGGGGARHLADLVCFGRLASQIAPL